MVRSQVTSAYLTDESRRQTRDSLLIFTGALLLFTVGLNPEFIGFQTRFGLFAQEMFSFGPSYFPTTYRSPYPDYPGTSTFLIYLVSLLVGQVSPFSAILPTAVTSALILVLTYQIGAIRSHRWGHAAVLSALFTAEFFNESRSIALDQYTSLATVLSFYLVYSATCYGRDKQLVLLPVVWFLSFAFRGPIGLVIPATVVCSYYLWLAKYKRFILAGMVAAVVLALGFACLLLAAKLQGGESFLHSVLNTQMTGRMHDRGPGYAYYWLRGFTSYAPAYPLAIIVLISRFKDILGRKNDDDILLGSLACWILIVLVGMSIPSVKNTRYILPIVPALSLVASYLLIDASPKAVLIETKKLFLGLCALLSPSATIGVLAVFIFAWRFEPHWQAHYLSTLFILVFLTFVGRRMDRTWKNHPNQGIALMSVALTAFVVVNIGITEPIYYSMEKTKPFVQEFEALQGKKPGKVVFFKIGPDGEDIKFMVNLSRPLEPHFVTSLDAISGSPGTYYIIAKEEVFHSVFPDDFRRPKLLIGGKIGHRDFVVFTQRQ